MVDRNPGRRAAVSPIAAVKQLSACIAVSNFEPAVEWYHRELGFELVQSKDFPEYGSRVGYLEANGVRIELVEDKQRRPSERPDPPNHTALQGISQLTFYIDDLDAIVEQVKRRPIKVAFGPVVVTDLGLKAFFIRDNEGNLIEFIQMLNGRIQ